MKLHKSTYFWLLVLSLPALWFLVTPGGYEPHDFHHIADIHQMYRAITSGQIPPRLGPDFYMSFGYPLFNYYYVLPFYLGAGFFALTGSLMEALKWVFLASGIVSVLGMYALLRKYFSSAASVAGAVLYLYTPFRAVEIYVRGAIGEAVAIALLPWVLYAFVALVGKTNKKNIALLAVVLGLFFITHNYFFLIAMPFIGLFTLIELHGSGKFIQKIPAVLSAILLGILASAYWWLPAFVEHRLVASATPFAIHDHFPFLKQLILPSWGYGSSVWGPYDLISFQIGIVNLIAVAVSILLFIKLRNNMNRQYKIALLAFVFFMLCVFMMNIRSMPVWKIIPFTNFIQFPWRFLGFTTFFSSFLAGFVVENLRWRKLAALLVIASCIILTVGYFRPSGNLLRTNEEYLNHFFNNTMYSEDYLQTPIGVSAKPTTPLAKFEVEAGEVLSIVEASPVSWRAEIVAESGSVVTANALAIPGWVVKVDGNPIQTRFKEPMGNMEFSLSAGLHTVELSWEETDLRQVADIMSLAALLIICYLFLARPRSRATI